MDEVSYIAKKYKRNTEIQMIDAVEDPINPRLPQALCKLLKHEKRFDEAISLLESLPPDIRQHKDTQLLASELRFLLVAGDIDDVTSLQT